MLDHESTGSLDRREFLSAALGAAEAAALGGASAAPVVAAPAGLVDVNVNLSRWPLRRLRGDDTSALADMLRRKGVAQAWAGSFDSLLHRDLAAVNAELADECRLRGHGLLVPMGSVNPKLPDWEEDLRRCAEVHRMPGIRLHPAYHGYKLDDPDFARLLRLAAGRGLVVQIVLAMEDERAMHPLLRVQPVSVAPLAQVVSRTPGVRLVLVNWPLVLNGRPLVELVGAGDVYVEIAMLEGVGCVADLVAAVPESRVLFGSFAPLFYFESALLKLRESPLSDGQLRAIGSENARRLLAENR